MPVDQKVLTLEQFQQSLPTKQKPTIDTSVASPSKPASISSLSRPSTSSEDAHNNNDYHPITPAASSGPKLVFKKPTKHQFSWSELSELIASKNLDPMGRSEQVQFAYQKAIKKRTKTYGSPGEYIRQRILHWPPAELCDNNNDGSRPSSSATNFSDGNESSTSCSSVSSPPSSPTGPLSPLEIVLKKNEFPYSVKKGIEHWLIWSRSPLTDEVWIRRYLEERLPGRDYLFFVNPPELQSVPSIFHVQVFTKGEGEVLDEEDMEIKKEEKEASRASSRRGSDASLTSPSFTPI
ncbi:hypothetical protein CPC16_008962 [Podila verticillata]|nr:hypothetical protein BGZ59_010769 [Podila verticillata]KAF9383349.1 hypothetical protein CPC16_008962 [Podila verticillata]KAI9231421.1 MAG: hypothetical protein BYD32DRAFT_430848 [Podila humilis]